MTRCALPLLGALALTFVFLRSAADMYDPENNYTTLFGVGAAFVLGIGGLILGAVLMVALSFSPSLKPFFRGETLTRGDSRCSCTEADHAVVIEQPSVMSGGAPDDSARGRLSRRRTRSSKDDDRGPRAAVIVPRGSAPR